MPFYQYTHGCILIWRCHFTSTWNPMLILPLQWRHNERDGISNHLPHDCLLNRYSKHRSKKTSKFCVTGLCAWNSLVTSEFPAQRASNAENVSFDDVIMQSSCFCDCIFLISKMVTSYWNGPLHVWFIPRMMCNYFLCFVVFCFDLLLTDFIHTLWSDITVTSAIMLDNKQLRALVQYKDVILPV